MEEPRVPEEEEVDFGAEDPPQGRRLFPTVLVLALIVAALVAAVLLFRQGKEGETPPPSEVALPVQEVTDLPAATVAPPPPAGLPAVPAEEDEVPVVEVDLPSLDESDDFARGLAAGVPSSWLASEELIRRFVAAVDNVAEGYSPRSHFPSISVKGKFTALEEEGRVILDPASYRRYDTLADIAAGIDAGGWIRVYRTLQPLCEEAYRDLGYPDREFDDALRRALERMLAVPVVDGDIVLMKQEEGYYFNNPRLEDLSPAGKHLLRMGPKNTRKVQGLLRALEAALDAHLE
jgi:hypothetical protein